MSEPRASVVGHAVTRFETTGGAVEDALVEASAAALASARGLAASDLDAVIVATNDNAKYMGAVLADRLGASPRAAHTVESMCASGSGALASAYAYVSAGLARFALVAGADRADGPGRVLEWDAARGAQRHPVFWASSFASAYESEYGADSGLVSLIAERAHRNAQDNPHAYEHAAHSAAEIAASREVAPRVRLLECSRTCTGAAAIVLAARAAAARFESPSHIAGVGQMTLGASISRIGSFSRMESASLAARSALGMAGIGAADVDVAEVHDAFSICEPIAAESIGLAPRGRGASMLAEMHASGDRRINPRGGLVGSGHALAATGIAQVCEIAEQLGGTAGKRQVAGARTGLAHNMAAASTSSSVLVLRS